MKTKSALFIMAIAAICCFAIVTGCSDESDADGDITVGDFTYTTSGTNATIKTYNNATATSVTVEATVTKDATTYNVISVGENAFKGKTALTSVVLPDSITTILSNSFDGCTGITSFQFGTGLTTYNSCGLTFYDTDKTTTLTDSAKLKGYHFTKDTTANKLVKDLKVTFVYVYSSTDKPEGYGFTPKGTPVAEPKTFRTGYECKGWYKDYNITTGAFSNQWNFSSNVTEEITLYGKIETKKVTSITITDPVGDLSMKVGDTKEVKATVTPSDAHNKNLVYSSSNKSVADFDGTVKNKLIAKGTGTAVITVTAADGGGASKSFNVTVSSGLSHTITVNVVGGGTASSTPTSAKYNETVTLTQTATAGNVFKGWTSSDIDVSKITNNTFKMPDKDVTITATFMIQMDIKNPEHGIIQGPTEVTTGSDATYKFIGDDGYLISEILIDSAVVAKDVPSYTLTKIDKSHIINATFVAHENAKTVIDGQGNITESYTDTVEEVKINLVKTFKVDGTIISTAMDNDDIEGVTLASQSTTDAEGKTTGSAYAVVQVRYDRDPTAMFKAANTLMKSAIEFTKAEETLMSFDLTTAEGTSKGFDLTFDATPYDGEYPIIFTGDNSALAMDKDAINDVKKKALRVSVVEADVSEMSDLKKWIINGNTAYDIDVGGVHSFKGKMALTVPITLPEGKTAEDVAVYYVGTYHAEKIGGTYEDGHITAELPHLSLYFAAVDYKESSDSIPGSYNVLMMVIFLIIIVLLFLAAGAFALFFNLDDNRLYLNIGSNKNNR